MKLNVVPPCVIGLVQLPNDLARIPDLESARVDVDRVPFVCTPVRTEWITNGNRGTGCK